MQVRPPGLPATPLAPTPLAAALSQSGISLPIPFLDLSAQVIRDLPLENVAALLRFIAEAKSELADRKSTRLNSSHIQKSRMPSSA